MKILPLDIKIQIRALLSGNYVDFAKSIRSTATSEVTFDDIFNTFTATRAQVYQYVEEFGLPEGFTKASTSDGLQMRISEDKFIVFEQERGALTDEKIFDDWNEMCRFVIDQLIDRGRLSDAPSLRRKG